MKALDSVIAAAGRSDRIGLGLMRAAIAVVFLWIGAVKFAPYEADSITPFVEKSTFLSFFYEHPEQWEAHSTLEGELVPAEQEWQRENNTYTFAGSARAVRAKQAAKAVTQLAPFAHRGAG